MAGNSQNLYQQTFIPYRNTSEREALIDLVYAQVAAAYNSNTNLSKPVFVRPGYWYDLNSAGATNLKGPTINLVALSSAIEGFAFGTVFTVTGPLTNVFEIYGFAADFPNPAVSAVKYQQAGKEYPIVYIHDQDPEDNRVLMRGLFPVVNPQNKVTITVLGTAAASAVPFEFLFAWAEQNPGQS